jgi:hypothetical protein
MFEKPKRWQSKKYRDAAKDQPCQMRIPGVCNGNNETTVLAHRNGGGMGNKNPDYDAADMCSSCHDEFDGKTHTSHFELDHLDAFFVDARYATIVNRITRGIIS